jgi:hypothetical protein
MSTAHGSEKSITRRALLRVAASAPVAAGLMALPTVPTTAKPRPVEPRTSRLKIGKGKLRRLARPELSDFPGRSGAARDIVTTDPIATDRFRVAALTWAGDRPSDAALLVRTRGHDSGEWSDWFTLRDDGHGPDPRSAEARSARRGTDIVIVEEADAVEVRIESPDGEVPADLGVELIDPGVSGADSADGSIFGGAAEAAPSRPRIRTRADWGADESMRGSATYGQVRGTFVHHTAGSNSYTKSDVPRIIRSIYAYHVRGRGWKDIGYNFLIDKYGRIWEGRHGGVTRAVIGAHTLGYNAYAFAAAVLGTHTNTTPTDEVIRAYQRLIAWKFHVHGVDPRRVSYPNIKDQPAIAGHRDAVATECPGERLYTRLSSIRGGVGRLLDS